MQLLVLTLSLSLLSFSHQHILHHKYFAGRTSPSNFLYFILLHFTSYFYHLPFPPSLVTFFTYTSSSIAGRTLLFLSLNTKRLKPNLITKHHNLLLTTTHHITMVRSTNNSRAAAFWT